jgi:magnesium-transporting ATPase (P-type)
MIKEDKVSWHQLEAEKVVRLLDVELRSGLTALEVTRRQAKYGLNRLTAQKRRSEWVRFLLQFHAPLLYILLAATVITAFLQEWVDGSVIFGVVLINAIVGYLQEAKAEKAIEALSKMVLTEATVRRDSRKQRVPSERLVPGDVVLLQSGDKVPADLRLFHVRDLQADESALTGESVPVEKHANALTLDTILAERKNLAFAGTHVTYGQAEGVVWAIGDQTEMGRIAMLVSETVNLSTPLTRKLARFSKLLLVAILGLAALTFVIGVWRGESLVAMFMAAVALAVAAIPEGLPAAVIITLAIGVGRMARQHAIIRKLPAVETLGSTTVICSDKTGTLTENQMTVQRVYAGGQMFEVTGGGYEAQGEIRLDGRSVSAAAHGGNPTGRPIRCGRGPSRAPRVFAGGFLVQRFATGEKRGTAGRARRPHGSRLDRRRAESGIGTGGTEQSASTTGCHPVRVPAPIHGDLARAERGRRESDLRQGRGGTPARALHNHVAG